MKQEIYIMAGFNEKYISESMEYIKSLNRNTTTKNIIFTLDFEIDLDIKEEFNNIEFRFIKSDLIKSPNPNTCMQHGGFLEETKEIPDEAIIIFTDTDIEVQRDLSQNEMNLLNNFTDSEVGINYNNIKNYTLRDEAEFLDPKISLDEIEKKFPDMSRYEVYNTGVIIARHKTYKNLYSTYNENWHKVEALFGLYAKQQWLLSYLIQKKFKPVILPYEIHSHDCHPWQLRIDKDNAKYKFCIGNDIVLFAHRMSHESRITIKKLKKIIKKLSITVIILSVVILILVIKSFFK